MLQAISLNTIYCKLPNRTGQEPSCHEDMSPIANALRYTRNRKCSM
jgi:hypothetical protein